MRIFTSWLSLLRRARPDKVILAEGYYTDYPLALVAAAYLVTRRQAYLMALHPAPEPPQKKSRKHWGFVPGIGLWWYRRIWPWRAKGRLIRKIVAVSNGIRDRLVRGYGLPREKVEVIYNGIDTTLFAPASEEARRTARRARGIPDHAVVIVSTARLNRIKRLDRLIKAFGALSATRDDLWLLLTGDGQLRMELEALGRSVDNAGRIKFLGHVPDVREVLHTSDIYVLPSDEEGFGIALAEAMACKLVCVATKTVGPCEIIENGQNGLLVDVTDEGVLKGVQKALALGRAERESMTTSARQTVLDRFRLEDAVAKALACLEIDRASPRQ